MNGEDAKYALRSNRDYWLINDKRVIPCCDPESFNYYWECTWEDCKGIKEDMKYEKITYQQTKNTGNYESKRLEMTAYLDPGDDYVDVAMRLKKEVERLLNREHETVDEISF